MRPWLRVAIALLASLSACSCSTPPPVPAPAPAPPPEAPEVVDPGPASIKSDIGGLPEDAMARAFASLDGPIRACLADASGRNAVVGGRFNLKIRIDPEGKARWAYLSETTLGDRDAERCVLTLVREKAWPKPLGGDGLAERAYELDAQAKSKELNIKWVKPAIAKARRDAWRCRKKGMRGKFRATAYLRPNGRVLAAGIAPPNERGEDAADCIVEAITKVRFGKPGRKSKIFFEIWW